ncbi:Gp37Gp68 family protein [Hydrogenophaga intermedia]|uniref:Gp37Gp68 family protein n=1 Tax=Hydrogenophaga intermedia TaxID=65786 RepID=A0A1L1PPV4_HYDIT|nr:phage Gp37/Gp68 family protein [Hydrogenophaga intermedia]CDN87365.1 Gp37Gp68 family protein [Hydrogenophaga intermedia]
MSANSKIEWTDHTFNPWIGCTKVSPACDHCYAERSTPSRTLGVAWGAGQPRRRTTPANWALPLRWNVHADTFMAMHGRRQRVFCASLADVFDNEVPDAWRADLFTLIAATPNLDWLLLTKRIGNAHRMIDLTMDAIDRAQAAGKTTVVRGPWPWPNVWLGATICNQEEADRDIAKLKRVPARVHFVSMEPLLSAVDLGLCDCDHGSIPAPHNAGGVTCPKCNGTGGRMLDWVIVGGESGPEARPMHPDWARGLRDQCQAAGVPFLFKQWGEFCEQDDGVGATLLCQEGDPDYHSEAAKCAAFISHAGHVVSSMDDSEPGVRYRGMLRPGKKAAGRQLDGRTWDEVPT